jgi:SAM-dependent methyltransferase
MRKLETTDRRALLGHPSQVWTSGLARRLALVQRYIPLEGRRLLDVGCGVGIFLRRFLELSPTVCGIDIDPKSLREAVQVTPTVALAVAEHLPFRDAVFDVVFMHEVLEHVQDDRAALQEACRVLGPGGHLVVFCPNRFFPFETHGVFLGRRYIFGNAPLVNYLPDPLRRRLVPHARAYTAAGLRRLWRGLPVRVLVHTQVFPGFDKAAWRWGPAGRALRELQRLEGTPLRILGLSHFVILSRES